MKANKSEGHKTKIIPLTQGLFALVDDEDFDLVNQYKWHVNETGNGSRFYARRSVTINGVQRQIYMHRFIMNCPDDMETDHGNGLTLHNCKSNLSNVSKKVNLVNRNYERRI